MTIGWQNFSHKILLFYWSFVALTLGAEWLGINVKIIPIPAGSTEPLQCVYSLFRRSYKFVKFNCA